jgi:uncharacterized protein
LTQEGESTVRDNEEPVPSPCIGVCVLDPRTGLCRGCLRTGSEIAAWRDADKRTRLDILRRLVSRIIDSFKIHDFI